MIWRDKHGGGAARIALVEGLRQGPEENWICVDREEKRMKEV